MEAIDQTEVQAELDKRTEEDLDELAEREDQGPSQNDESGNETSENEYEGIDHGDYFNKQRGQARVVQGDDAFDEEMGGVSQMIAATTMAAVQNAYSLAAGGLPGFLCFVLFLGGTLFGPTPKAPSSWESCSGDW